MKLHALSPHLLIGFVGNVSILTSKLSNTLWNELGLCGRIEFIVVLWRCEVIFRILILLFEVGDTLTYKLRSAVKINSRLAQGIWQLFYPHRPLHKLVAKMIESHIVL